MINLESFEYKQFSQNGEDGILMKLVGLIYDDNINKSYVEFGVSDGSECNTRILREIYGWKGLQMDGGNEIPNINLRKEFITRENIIELFRKYNIPERINVLSVDIDFNDFYCLREILKHYECDIIICEYNSTHLPNEDKVVVYNKNARWDFSNYFGVSLLTLTKLCNLYNYSLIYCDKKGVNAFFIKNSIIENKNLKFMNCGDINAIYRSPKYGWGPNGGHKEDMQNRPYLTYDEAMLI